MTNRDGTPLAQPLHIGHSGRMWRQVISTLFVGACVVSCGSNKTPENAAVPSVDAASTVPSMVLPATTQPSLESATTVLPGTTQASLVTANDAALDAFVPVHVDQPCPQSDPAGGTGPAVGTESSRLEPMLGQVLAYGQQHADQFGSYGFVWQSADDASVFISFTANVDEHRDALARIVQFPDQLVVCQAALPGDQAAALLARLTTELEGKWVTIGSTGESVAIGLPSGQDELAEDLKTRYGDAVKVTVGVSITCCDVSTTAA